MISRMKEWGYVPNKSQVLFSMDEEEKENALCRHSAREVSYCFWAYQDKPGDCQFAS